MDFVELNADQRRQRIDAKQAFEVWRAADRDFRHSYRGSMHWRRVAGREYLSRKHSKNVWEQIGPRSTETERIRADYDAQRKLLRARLTKLDRALDGMNKINRAMNLGRVPDIAARVLSKLDSEDLLGRNVLVAGTHSLYAYEARAGILFDGELTATKDIDLLFDARQRFTFVMQEVRERGFIGLLKQVDGTFKKVRGYNAANDDPYVVDLIRPEKKNEGASRDPEVSLNPGDLQPAPIRGLQWLQNAPRFEEVVIGENGRPVLIVCADPRAFALHKLWLSKQPERGAARRRDALQAVAVAAVAHDYLGMKFDRKELMALPGPLLDGMGELFPKLPTKRR